MKPWRVCIFSVVPSPYQRDLFAALAARPEVDLSVYYLEDASPDSPWPKRPLADYEAILDGRWFKLGAVRWHVNKNLPDTSGFDLVVVNSFMSSAGQSLMRKRLVGQKWVFWGERMRDQTVGWRSVVQQQLTSPINNASAIVAIGTRAAEDYQERFPDVPVHSVPYHCDLSEFQKLAQQPHSNHQFTFLFCGQMIARKGLDILVQAFAKLVDAGADVRLVLVGREAELPQCLAAVSQSTRDRIDNRGFRAPEDLPAEFARADAFVLPSRYDGWGVVVNQALGAGLPIICSDAVGAGVDLVTPDQNGLIFVSGNVTSLHAAMRKLADNPEQSKAWGRDALERSHDWTPERGAERWLNVIKEVVTQ